MNSLLQTLFMTPEFRSALYRWKYEGGDDEDCIPYQLQRLFGVLQLTSRGSVETTALTRSFGWGASDGFQQHDVQELCRVLFDALERVLAGTPHATLVNDLYQGTLTDYVRCKECGTEKGREDSFLDVSLVLRPFGSTSVMSSVEASLDYFLKPETLEGDNQYLCETCGKKCDAVKGLKFRQLPYLLSLQLKRFDYDFSTFARIKLNDEVRFPLLLDMNPYMQQQQQQQQRHGDGGRDAPQGQGQGQGGLAAEGADGQALPPLPDLLDAEGTKAPDQVEEEVRSALGHPCWLH
jgi:ubiquitin carboxyl-terminal hydrolase 47